MTKEELKKHREQFRPLLEGWLEGREIEYKSGVSDWYIYDIFNSMYDTELRLKHEPQYRPWTLEEVPVGAVVVRKEPKIKSLITNAGIDGVILGGRGPHEYQQLLEQYTLPDGSPCGVIV